MPTAKSFFPARQGWNDLTQRSLLEKIQNRITIQPKGPVKRENLTRQPGANLTTILRKYLRGPIPAKEHLLLPRHLPLGHHQVHFNPVFSENYLLQDGTDKDFWPGPPFYQRLWAGGSLVSNPIDELVLCAGSAGFLQEDVEDVRVTGSEEDAKVFVTISRKFVSGLAPSMHSIDPSTSSDNIPDLRYLPGTNLVEGRLGELALEEKKTLVFMRPVNPAVRRVTVPRIVKPLIEPDYSITITPTAHLLSRFSQLTLNAHRIHLDRKYCEEVESHRNLLVHGPLTQVMMLEVLRSQLHKANLHQETIVRLDYKNLAPLYADEPMRICLAKDRNKPGKYAIWVEGKDGGYAVRATAEIAKRQVVRLHPRSRRVALEPKPKPKPETPRGLKDVISLLTRQKPETPTEVSSVTEPSTDMDTDQEQSTKAP